MKLYIILIFVFLLITFVGIVYVDIGYTNPEKFLKDLNFNYINQWIVRLDTNIPNQNFIDSLPDNIVVEVPCIINKRGVNGIKFALFLSKLVS